MNIAELASPPISRADLERCVACGLCLPLCPTYNVARNENASPRGRLALMRGLLTSDLAPDEEIANHLSLCLQCRRCEAACPAGVEYGRLIDAAKDNLLNAGFETANGKTRLIARLIASSKVSQLAFGRLLTAATRLRLLALGRSIGLLRLLGLEDMASLLPPKPVPFIARSFYPATGNRRGEAALFTGCITSLVDGESLFATIRVLTRLGFDVHIPREQNCCGAMHRHQGDHVTANKLTAGNINAFSGSEIPVISVATGCGAHLSEYPNKQFAARISDINTFLVNVEWPTNVGLNILPKKVLVQDPCSLRNVLRQEKAVYQLLHKIPDLKVVSMPQNDTCCGGAGDYPLREPEMAIELRRAKVEAIVNEQFDYIASTNIGCALHMMSGLREAGEDIEIVHPIVLIDRMLEN